MNSHVFALISAIAGGALGQLLMKHAMSTFSCFGTECSLSLLLQQHGGILLLGAGIFLYFLSILFWIFALKKFQLNYAYPMLSCGYIVVYLGAALPPISEPLTTQKTLGVMLILAGVTLSAQQTIDKRREV